MLGAAWLGAALFAAALARFAYLYLVELGSPAPVTADTVPAAIATDVALFSAFALHHSVLARSGVKRRLRTVLPPGAERTTYVWVASLLFLVVCSAWQPLPGVAWRADERWSWLLYGVQLAGLVIALRGASRIDIWELAGVRQARASGASPSRPAATPQQPAASSPQTPARALAGPSVPGGPPAAPLEVAGPYAWVRHPIYFGWVLFVFGAPTMTVSRLLFAAVSTCYLVVAIPFEERSLAAEFGPAYEAYSRRVRWRLVPGIW